MEKRNPLFDKIEEYGEASLEYKDMEKKLWEEFGAEKASLVLDSTGFTRVTKEKGIIYFLILISKMRKIAFEIVSKNRCTNFRAEADNIYGEFDSVDDAVIASFQLHEAIKNEDLYLNDREKFSVCIGVGFGRLLMAGEDGLFGDEMNLASKLGEDTAEAGETLLSENAFRNIKSFEVEYEQREIEVSGVTIKYYSCNQKNQG